MYLLTDEATQSSAVIDPYAAKEMLAEVSNQGVKVSRTERASSLTCARAHTLPAYR